MQKGIGMQEQVKQICNGRKKKKVHTHLADLPSADGNSRPIAVGRF